MIWNGETVYEGPVKTIKLGSEAGVLDTCSQQMGLGGYVGGGVEGFQVVDAQVGHTVIGQLHRPL